MGSKPGCSQLAAHLLPPFVQTGKDAKMAEVNRLYNEAEQLKDAGQLEQAAEKLNELLAAEPKHVLSHLALAVIYGRLGQHEKAVEHGKQACITDPSDACNFTAMSVTYQRAWQLPQRVEYVQLAEDSMTGAHQLQ